MSLKDVVTGKTATAKPKQDVATMLEKYKGEIQRALPRHMTGDRMARIVLTECRKVPKLMNSDVKSLFGAVIQCAQLGLEPGGALGHAYLLPFDNRKKGITEVQVIIGYRGMIDLARRSGQIVSISARIVREGDDFAYTYGLDESLRHIPTDNDNAPITHVYAVARLKDGGTQFEVLTRKQVEKVRAGSRASNDGPWVTHFEEMAKKTAIRRLFKMLPVSIEISTAISMDEQADAGVSQQNAAVIDGVFEQEIDEPKEVPQVPIEESKPAETATPPSPAVAPKLMSFVEEAAAALASGNHELYADLARGLTPEEKASIKKSAQE